MLRQYSLAVKIIIIIQRLGFQSETAMYPQLRQLRLAQPTLDVRQKHIFCSENAMPDIRTHLCAYARFTFIHEAAYTFDKIKIDVVDVVAESQVPGAGPAIDVDFRASTLRSGSSTLTESRVHHCKNLGGEPQCEQD